MTDLGGAPREALRGDAARRRPIFAKENIGPWHGEVTVTPVVRLDGRPFFEVSAAWGPGASGEDVPGLFGQPSSRAIDAAAVDDAEGAERIARVAVDALRDPGPGRLPPLNLPALASELGVPLVRQG